MVGVDDIVDPPDTVWLSVNPDEDPTEAFSWLGVGLVAWTSPIRHISFDKKPISIGKITHIEINSALNWEVRTSKVALKITVLSLCKNRNVFVCRKVESDCQYSQTQHYLKWKIQSQVQSRVTGPERTVLAGRPTFKRKWRFWLFELTWIHIIENR